MNKQYLILRDKQEKKNFWHWEPDELWLKTEPRTLETGDYTIEGMEEIFTIDRKNNTGEIAANFVQKRFERELDRMDLLPHPFIVCQFNMEDIFQFPFNSGIPPRYWKNLRMSANYLLKRMTEIQLNHNVKIIMAGDRSFEVADRILYEMVQKYG